MLLEHLYKLSLEPVERLGMFTGMPVHWSQGETYRLDLLVAYINGLEDAAELIDSEYDDINPFFSWLKEARPDMFPTAGWEAFLLGQADGDHIAAIATFFRLMHEYLAHDPPQWFLEFNSSPRPSIFCNADGEPRTEDVRLPAHVALAKSIDHGET